MVRIRRATLADAGEGITTLRRSIIELCAADHHGDADMLDAWLRNKTTAQWEIWVAQEDALLLVAEQQSAIVGVAAATLRGEILLNYVHPEARFSDVSKAMLAALEDELGRHNVAQTRLKSTVTARPFYVSCGYRSEASGDYLAKDLQE